MELPRLCSVVFLIGSQKGGKWKVVTFSVVCGANSLYGTKQGLHFGMLYHFRDIEFKMQEDSITNPPYITIS